MHPLAGRKQSPEHIAKRTASMLAAKEKWTPEYREAVRLKFLADRCKVGDASRLPRFSGSDHPQFGKPMSDKARAALLKANLGRKQSPETVARRMASRSGYKHSEETKERLRRPNIRTWSRPEIRAKTTGPNSPSWLGGKSFIPYPETWTFALREKIRERDGRVCRRCGKSELENSGKRLEVHHIDYDKLNLAPSNLASLCKPCHMKSNYNRQSWMDWFGANPISSITGD